MPATGLNDVGLFQLCPRMDMKHTFIIFSVSNFIHTFKHELLWKAKYSTLSRLL